MEAVAGVVGFGIVSSVLSVLFVLALLLGCCEDDDPAGGEIRSK